MRLFNLKSIVYAMFFGFAFMVSSISVKADEGMWLPMLVERLNYTDMQKYGLKLTAEELYSINHSSLKDAIIQFGNGCTGEIISNQGLILTNHHCGYGSIQSHSTTEHDYLLDGFWAKSFDQELPNPGLTARFLIRVEDVTSQILSGVTNKMTETERALAVKSNIAKAVKTATEGTDYEASVRPFFNGNEYYLFVSQVFYDVRLVGAPPSSIGKFGGETDNWMWPRHTGDFSIFRVYTDKDGKPAKYSKDNIPMKPKHHLPISLNGVHKDDFAMIMGYPGRTDRYLTSYGINYNLELMYPTRIEIRRKKLDIMQEYMNVDQAVRIQYASKYAGISNYWKNFIGMSRGLKRLNVAAKKKALEDDFKAWVGQYPSREEMYGNALKDIENAYKIMSKYAIEQYTFNEAIQSGPELLSFALAFNALNIELTADTINQEKVKKMTEMLKGRLDNLFKDIYMPVEKKLFAEMMMVYNTKVNPELQPEYFKTISAKFKNDYYKMAETYYAKSMFSDKAKLTAFLDNPDKKVLAKDPMFILAKNFVLNTQKLQKETESAYDMLSRGNRLFLDGIRKMEKDRKFAPDANSTMRLTYGKVLDYYPADAVHYEYFTTLDGIIQKEDPNNKEFIVPQKLKDLYYTKDFGQYGENGIMKVAFLSNTDITGGNSGSPVINGNGELIGLAFDGNWEAMSGDIAFEPDLQRTISVDIRYVLFIVDKYAGASNLINELTLRKKEIQ